MSTFKKRRCVECGQGMVRLVAKAGRRERYKTMTLDVPAHVEIPTCDHCGTEWMDEGTASKITKALAVVYRERLHEMLGAALGVLLDFTSVSHLEELFGLSEGYVSRLKSRRKTPRPVMVSGFVLAARDPEKRLRELEDDWAKRAS